MKICKGVTDRIDKLDGIVTTLVQENRNLLHRVKYLEKAVQELRNDQPIDIRYFHVTNIYLTDPENLDLSQINQDLKQQIESIVHTDTRLLKVASLNPEQDKYLLDYIAQTDPSPSIRFKALEKLDMLENPLTLEEQDCLKELFVED